MDLVLKENYIHNNTFSFFHIAIIFRVWPPQLASYLRSTFCALCVKTSSPAQWPYHVDTVSACPVSATTGLDTSPNTAPTVRECLLTGPSSPSTTSWQMSQTTTGWLDQRNHLTMRWYLIIFVCYQMRGNFIWKWLNPVCLCNVTVAGYRCRANDSGKTAENIKVKTFLYAPKGALKTFYHR